MPATAVATLKHVLVQRRPRRVRRSDDAQESETDEPSLWSKTWPYLVATLGAAGTLALVLRSRSSTQPASIAPTRDLRLRGGTPQGPGTDPGELDPGLRDSRVFSTYSPSPDPRLAAPLFKRIPFDELSAGNPGKGAPVSATALANAVRGDIDVSPTAASIRDVSTQLRMNGWRQMTQPVLNVFPETPSPVVYHEAGHGFDPHNKNTALVEDHGELMKELVAGIPLSREKVDQAFEGEIPAMVVENSAAMASGWPKPNGWVYDKMQKHVPITNDVAQDAKSIKTFMQGLRSPDTELGRRYLDYLKAQGVQAVQ